MKRFEFLRERNSNSKENNFPELAYATTKNVLTKNEMIIGKDLTLDVLSRDKVSKVYEL